MENNSKHGVSHGGVLRVADSIFRRRCSRESGTSSILQSLASRFLLVLDHGSGNNQDSFKPSTSLQRGLRRRCCGNSELQVDWSYHYGRIPVPFQHLLHACHHLWLASQHTQDFVQETLYACIFVWRVACMCIA